MHFEIAPEVAESFPEVAQNRGLGRARARGVLHLDIEDDGITRAMVSDGDLPIRADADDTAQHLVEYPWTHVAHAADHHLVAATAYLCDPAHRHPPPTPPAHQPP